MRELLGADEAAALMPPIAWEQVATKADIAELRGEIAELRGELRELRGELRELRGEMLAILGGQTWKIVTANLAGSAAVAAAVVAAIRL